MKAYRVRERVLLASIQKKKKVVEERKGKIMFSNNFFCSNSEKWSSLALLRGITFVRAATRGLLGRVVYYCVNGIIIPLISLACLQVNHPS